MASPDVTFKAIHCWTNLFKLIHILPPSRQEGVFVHLIVCVLLICLSCFDFACCAFDSVCSFDTCHALVIEWTPLIHWTFPTPPNLDQFATMSLYICLRSKVYSIGYCSWKSQIESTWIVLRHFLAFVEAQLANWYKLGWFGSFELLRCHLSDLLEW